MKTSVAALVVLVVCSVNGVAQDYTQWGLPEGASLRIGRGEITELKYSPDGSRFAVASSIGIWIYDTMSLREISLLVGHSAPVESVAFSRDGKLLASGSRDYTVKLWDAETGAEKRTFIGHWGRLFSVDFNRDGRLLASGGSDGTVRIWDVKSGEEIHTLTGHTDFVTSVVFFPTANTVVSASNDNTIRLWDADTGDHLRTVNAHADRINYLAFSRDGTILASSSYDSTIRLWDAVTWELRRTLDRQGWTRSLAFSMDGRSVASGTNWEIRLLDTETGLLRRTLRGHRGDVLSVDFSPDGTTIASAGSGQTIRFWDATTGNHLRTLSWTNQDFRSVAYSPDGRTIATGNEDFSARLWDANTGGHLQTFDGYSGAVNSLAFSPNGGMLASGSTREILLWDLKKGRHLRTLNGHSGKVTSLVFGPDGKTLASGGGEQDYTVRLWNTETGTQLHELIWHARPVIGITFSSDGRTLASAGLGGSMALWDTSTGEPRQTLDGYRGERSVVFDGDGKTLIGASTRVMRIWDTVTGESTSLALAPAFGFGNPVFSADARLLAIGQYDDVWLWDVGSGEHVRTFSGHTRTIRALAMRPNGRGLASASEDGTVLVWDTTPLSSANSTVRISPSSITSPLSGEHLRLSLEIEAGENVAGFQAIIYFDPMALRHVESEAGDYLPDGSFFDAPVVNGNHLKLVGASVAGASHGDGVLAMLTFEVLSASSSDVTLFDASLVDSEWKRWFPHLENGIVIEPVWIEGDVNYDGVVNVLDLVLIGENFTKSGENDADVNGDGVVDIVDLVLVAGALGGAGAAPSAPSMAMSVLRAADVEHWLAEARGLDLANPTWQRGIRFLEGLVAALTPKRTTLLSNFPNPFNPETWIPYRLAHGTEVEITIYDVHGALVRQLGLGHQAAGHYADRGRAAYWDGRNDSGESVASGVYYYRLRAGDYAASRRMVVVK